MLFDLGDGVIGDRAVTSLLRIKSKIAVIVAPAKPNMLQHIVHGS